MTLVNLIYKVTVEIIPVLLKDIPGKIDDVFEFIALVHWVIGATVRIQLTSSKQYQTFQVRITVKDKKTLKWCLAKQKERGLTFNSGTGNPHVII